MVGYGYSHLHVNNHFLTIILMVISNSGPTHLCRLQQQATFSSSIANQMREKNAKLSKIVELTRYDAASDELFSRIAHSSIF